MQTLSIHFTRLKSCLDNFVKLEPQELEELPDLFRQVQLKKNQNYINEGEICKKIGFLSEGMVRYYYRKQETEVTSDFAFEGSFITSYHSLITQEKSDSSIQALQDSILLEISYENLVRKYDENKNYERLGRLLAEQTFLSGRKHLLGLLNNTAEERYRNLIERAPHFVQNIQLHFIASYLGITPETLSRIRKKLSVS